MTTVYFIRHSLRDLTVTDDDFGAPLTQEGSRRAKAIVPLFENVPLDAIFSSPYRRTVDTVLPLAQSGRLEIQTVPDFRERETGVWLDDFSAYAEQQWADFDFKLKTGESLNEVQTRNITALNKILKNLKNETIVIGTHGTALSTIINHYDATFAYADFQRISGIMPWIVKMTFDGLTCLTYEEIELEGKRV